MLLVVLVINNKIKNKIKNMNLKIILSLISYCGIEYNHNKWHSHINKCEICNNYIHGYSRLNLG